MRVVHLPFYSDNPYQTLLMQSQRALGLEVQAGGGGGNFLRSALFRWHADVIHFHWLHPYMICPTVVGTILRSVRFVLELMLLRLSGRRLIWTMHNDGNHDRKHATIERFFRRLVVPFFHKVVVHSQFAKDRFQEQFGCQDKVSVYLHPSYEGAYPNVVDRETARAALNVPADAITFLFLGRILAYKGVLELIAAFQTLPQSHLRLIIAGGAGDREELHRVQEAVRADHRIIVHAGYVPSENLQYYFHAADVVAFPFREILTSGSVVLAMGFGCPVIVPACGGILETLPEQYPLVFERHEESSLNDVLKNTAENPAMLDELGPACRNKVLKSTWDGYAALLLQLYQPKAA